MSTNKNYQIQEETYETSATSGCEITDFPTMPEGSGNYRYFNQPIEQIPGWNANKPQILFHGKNAGLVWSDIQCLPVVTCVQITGVSSPAEDPTACNCELSITRHNLYILKDAGINETECEIELAPMSMSVNGPYVYNELTKQWESVNSTT